MTSTFGKVRFGSTGNGVAPLSTGLPPAMYPGAIATNQQLVVAVNRLQTALAVALGATDTQMIVQSGIGIVPSCLLTIDNEIVQVISGSANTWQIARGFDGTAAAFHLSNALVSGFVDAWHHNALVSEVQAIQTFLGPNGTNLPTTAVRTPIPFPAQTPGGNLIVGANVITLSPVPQGVNGSDQNHYLYISGGTGTAEAALITGGSAVAGAPTGQLIITCANTHSGAWTIQSATAGIQEAIVNSPVNGRVVIPGGNYILNGKISVGKTMSLRGQGMQNTYLIPATGFVGRAIEWIPTTPTHGVDIGDFSINYSTFGTSGEGLYLQDVTDGLVSELGVLSSWNGINAVGTGRVVYAYNNLFPRNDGYQFSSNPSSTVITVSVPTVIGGFITMSSPTVGDCIHLGPVIAGAIITGLSTVWGRNAVSAISAAGSINEVQITDCILDSTGSCGISLILMSGATASRWMINGNMLSSAAGGSAIQNINMQASASGGIQGLQICGNKMLSDYSGAYGILLEGVVGAVIDGNIINCNTPNIPAGIAFAQSACTDIMVSGNSIGLGSTYTPAGGAACAVFSDSAAHARIRFSANQFIGPINWNATGPDNFFDSTNQGLTVNIITSASAITIGPFPVFSIPGTVPIATINGGVQGQSLVLIFTGATPGGLVTGGNIARAQTAAQNQSIRLTLNGGTWY